MTERGRPARYLTIDRFEKFIGNDWRHALWKINGLLVGFIIVIGLLVTILFGVASLILG